MESTYSYVPGLWLYILSTVVLLMFLAAQLPRIHLKLAKRIIWVLFTAFLWNFFLIFEFMVSTVEMKMLYAKIQYIGIVSLPVAWFALSAEVSSRRLSKRVRVLSSVPPIIFLIYIFFIPQPNLFWGVPTIEDTSIFPVMDFHYGPLYYFGFLPFVYLMILISVITLWRNYGTRHPHYRRQKLLLTLALLLPGVTNLLYNFDLSPIKGLNLSTATLTISGVLFYFILYRNSLLDLVPITRDQIVENLDEAVLIFNQNQRLIDFNQTAAKLFDLGQKSIGLPVGEIGVVELTHRVENIQDTTTKTLTLLDGLVYDISINLVKEPHGEFFKAMIVTLRDITHEQLLNQQLQMLAQRDSLTGLYNRRTLFSQGKKLLAANSGHRVAAIMIDLDNFKEMNDTYGHAYGDTILQTVGEALSNLTTPKIIVGRIGGDEFVLLTVEQDVQALAERLSKSVSSRLSVVAKEGLKPTLSIGVSTLNLEECKKEDPLEYLLIRADQAMYQAKSQGKNQTAFIHDPENASRLL